MERATLGMGGRNDLAATTVEWYTPPHIFEALGLTFDLDPCAPPGGVPWIPAEAHYSELGLLKPWTGRVWLNPPYGNETQHWVDRLALHGNGVALVFARTDPKWGQRALAAADAVCFVAGRIRFVSGLDRSGPGHNAPVSSMLLAYGDENASAVLSCGLGVSFRGGA